MVQEQKLGSRPCSAPHASSHMPAPAPLRPTGPEPLLRRLACLALPPAAAAAAPPAGRAPQPRAAASPPAVAAAGAPRPVTDSRVTLTSAQQPASLGVAAHRDRQTQAHKAHTEHRLQARPRRCGQELCCGRGSHPKALTQSQNHLPRIVVPRRTHFTRTLTRQTSTIIL